LYELHIPNPRYTQAKVRVTRDTTIHATNATTATNHHTPLKHHPRAGINSFFLLMPLNSRSG